MSKTVIFRGRSLKSGEWIVGDLVYVDGYPWLGCADSLGLYHENKEQVDHSTISISLPSMIDKNGNDIFASVYSEKGGDIFIHVVGKVRVKGTNKFVDNEKIYIADFSSGISWQYSEVPESITLAGISI